MVVRLCLLGEFGFAVDSPEVEVGVGQPVDDPVDLLAGVGVRQLYGLHEGLVLRRSIFAMWSATVADNPIYIFTEPRVGYRMPKGEAHGQETES